ncbi:MAG: DedA family protein [Chloroflexota bacterium]
MSSFSDLVLTSLVNYGAPALGVALLIGALGVPVPGTVLLIAGGAFVRQGFIGLTEAALYGFIGAVLGDHMGFFIGRFGGHWVNRRFAGSSLWGQAQTVFGRYGGASIYLTRFAITSLAIPVNLIAGGSSYRLGRFTAYDLLGELTWVALFGGLGYAFGSQWEEISTLVQDFGGMAVGVAALIAGIIMGIRMLRRR